MKKMWIVACLAALALVAGCHKGGSSQNSTQMRALNASVDSEPLDVLVDQDVKVSALAYGNTSAYSEFDSGSREVQVRSSTNQSILSDKTISFASGVQQTLLIYGHRAALQSQLLADDTTAISSGHLRVRIANLAPDSGPVDLYITNGPFQSSPVIISNAAYGSLTGSAEISPGSLQITLTSAGTQDVLFQSTAQTFTAGDYYTILVLPSLGGKLVSAVLLTQGGDGVFLQNPFARLKAVNDIPGTSLNFKVDGTSVLLNVPYSGTSSYVTSNSGTHTVAVEQSNVPGTVIGSTSTNLAAARDYSVIATGSGTAATLTLLPDDNTLPNAGSAKIRFVNGLTSGDAVDVLLNFASQVQALPFVNQSSYYQVAPSTTYTITFTTQGGVSVLATLTPVELDAGGVYTAYLLGPPDSATIRVVRDR